VAALQQASTKKKIILELKQWTNGSTSKRMEVGQIRIGIQGLPIRIGILGLLIRISIQGLLIRRIRPFEHKNMKMYKGPYFTAVQYVEKYGI
jgi:hypothetical protein